MPTNYEVLQRQLRVLDLVTVNRDQGVWAVARGTGLEVDDANTPPLIGAATNLPDQTPTVSISF